MYQATQNPVPAIYSSLHQHNTTASPVHAQGTCRSPTKRTLGQVQFNLLLQCMYLFGTWVFNDSTSSALIIQFQRLRSRKQRLTTVGIRCANHVTPLYPEKLALTSPTGGGRSVGIVRLRSKATEFMGITKEVAKLFTCTDLEVTESAHSERSLCVR